MLGPSFFLYLLPSVPSYCAARIPNRQGRSKKFPTSLLRLVMRYSIKRFSPTGPILAMISMSLFTSSQAIPYNLASHLGHKSQLGVAVAREITADLIPHKVDPPQDIL